MNKRLIILLTVIMFASAETWAQYGEFSIDPPETSRIILAPPTAESIVDTLPPGPWVTFVKRDSFYNELAYIGKPLNETQWEAWDLGTHWDCDFCSTPYWEVLRSGNTDYWVLTTCVAWSHTRYEEQDGDKNLTRTYWLAGPKPQPVLSITEYFETWYLSLDDSIPARSGSRKKVEISPARLKVTTWDPALEDNPEMNWRVEQYEWENGKWTGRARTDEHRENAREEGEALFRKGKGGVCSWWFEGNPHINLPEH